MKTKTVVIKLLKHTGSFAENKDTARSIREKYIYRELEKGKDIVLDYSGVNSTTQSFTHALISDLIKEYGSSFFDRVSFKNCSPTVQRVIKIVAEYMQRSLKSEG